MTIDEVSKKPSNRGRKQSRTAGTTQHSIWMEQELWEALEGLPISRPEIFREAALNYIAFYNSDLPKLKYQLELGEAEEQRVAAKNAVLRKRIEELEAKAVIELDAEAQAKEKREKAVSETLLMCKHMKKHGINVGHLNRLEEMSGVDAAQIEAFITDSKYRPTEEQVRAFYLG